MRCVNSSRTQGGMLTPVCPVMRRSHPGMKARRNTARASLRYCGVALWSSRHPYYDSRIVEFLVRIPPGIRFRGGRSKRLLREAMTGVVPDEVRRRTPHGAFEGIFERGIKQIEAPRLDWLLEGSSLAELGVLDTDLLGETFASYLGGDDTKRGKAFWVFFTEEWLRKMTPETPGRGESRETEPVAGRSSVL